MEYADFKIRKARKCQYNTYQEITNIVRKYSSYVNLLNIYIP